MNTGSTTRLEMPESKTASATASMIAVEDSIPVLAASTPMSCTTARICAPTTRAGTSATPDTPRVFWTVTEVMALIPHTPRTAKVLRSAWIPAPPPESEPAMLSARGGGASGRRTKVIPPLARERPLGAIRFDGDQAYAFPDLPDVGERRPESRAEHVGRSLERSMRKGGEQLVVLASGKRQLERVQADRRPQLGQAGRHGHGIQPYGSAHVALPAQPGQVSREPVRNVDHRRGSQLSERLHFADPGDGARMRGDERAAVLGGERAPRPAWVCLRQEKAGRRGSER